jgi:predicted nucleic acid-binding protein
MSVKKKAFLDTNILVYQFDHSAPQKQKQAVELIRRLLLEERVLISSQVAQEFINVALKKFKSQLPVNRLQSVMLDLIKPLCAHYTNFDFYERAIQLYDTNSLNFYDAMIIQAALDLNCDLLYSEDLQDGQRFGKLTILNPFKN